MKSATLHGIIFGMILVRADGPFTERLLNICMHRNLYITDIKRVGKNRVIFKTDIESFKKLHTPVHRTKSKIKIEKKFGFPFFRKRLQYRIPAICVLLSVIILSWYASTHIMGITVFGNTSIDTNTIYSALNECGIYPGIKTSKIDNNLVRNKMMTKLDDLAWIGINANGSRVYVEIIERIEKDEGIIKDGAAYNLVASKDGIIEHTEVKEGQTLVKNGSGVLKGDVLVSGIVDNPIKGFEFVKARGEVYAETKYTKTREYPLNYTENIYTGNETCKYSVKILNIQLPIYLKKEVSYSNFTDEEKTYEYRIPIDFLPSVFITKTKFSEYISEDKKRSVAEAVSTGINELSDELKSEISENVRIKSQTESHTLTEHGGVEVTVTLICIENIAEKSVIESPESIE